MTVLFDTNILIDHLKGIPPATKEIRLHAGALISRITWIEVLSGTSLSDETSTRSLLESFLCLEIDSEIAERAAEIRRRDRLKLPDAVILATAQLHRAILVTRNTHDFSEKMPGVRVPYRV